MADSMPAMQTGPVSMRASASVVTLHVCVTCKTKPADDTGATQPRGLPLLDAVAREIEVQGLSATVRVEPVECLSVCKRPATIAVSGAGRWTYVYGDLDPAVDLPALIDGLRSYVAAPDGLIPWKQRPQIFKSGVVARIPPVPALAAAPEGNIA